MDKKTLLSRLEDALKIEENHTPLIARFYSDDYRWDGLSEDEVINVRNMFKVIEEQTLAHQRTVRAMIEWVRTDGRNEF